MKKVLLILAIAFSINVNAQSCSDLQQFTTDVSKLRDFTQGNTNEYLNVEITELQQAFSFLFEFCGCDLDTTKVSNVNVTTLAELQDWLGQNEGVFYQQIGYISDECCGDHFVKTIFIGNAVKSFNFAKSWQ